jgi:hypothetical protein
MRLLHAGTDTSVIALWLGHEQAETTQIYLHADVALKERALARTKPPDARPGRYRPPDNSWPSWKPSDYADLPAAHAAATSSSTRQVGIIGRSA